MRFDLRVTLLGLLGLVAWELSGLDQALIAPWGSPQGFAWSESFWTRTLIHDGGRWLGWSLFALVLWAGVRGAWGVPASTWRGTAALMLACVLLVSWLKSRSLTSCPWSLAEYGGVARHVPHWALGVADGGPGHCFPSGHASTGFAFLAVYFAVRHVHPARARRVLALTIAFGLLFGFTQMIRGAHYASHTLWTAWICWTVCVVIHHLFWARKDLPPPSPPLLH